MIPDDVGPLQFLASRARAMPDVLLATLETLGLLAVLSILAWSPQTLKLALPFLALSMFGFWGIAEHARQARDPLRRDPVATALFAVQGICVLIGACSIAAAIFTAVGWAIGPIVS